MYKVSVIIPVFNCYDELSRNISTLLRQKFTRNRVEWLLVDDGSTDGSLIQCIKLEAKYHNVKVFKQEHKGVSAARNLGIRNATGKYIFFVDADDEITLASIRKCVKFFDSIGDECDLVTYPIETEYQGKILAPHFRYQFLSKTGVYDLCDNPFIGQTTMNIVVRNKFENNVLFDETLSICEDQKYCCDIVAEKLKMGFCAEAKYIYHRSPESSSGKLAGACYMFEPCMKLFEEVFSRYEHVPMAFQGLFVNDVAWKLRANIFWPYHYDEDNYDRAIKRVRTLLKKCFNYTILEHPAIDYFEKYYLMRLKGEDSIQAQINADSVQLYSENYLVSDEKSLEMVITKVHIDGFNARIEGFIKSVFFQFYNKDPEVLVTENNSKAKTLEVSPSTHNYYLSHESTQRFWRVSYSFDSRNIRKFYFAVKLQSTILPVHFYFMEMTPFSHKNHIYRYEKDNVRLFLRNNTNWYVESVKNIYSKERIWLYYDCKGVAKDNGLLQYNHDKTINDGVNRYYIVSDEKQKLYLAEGAQVVAFGSNEHIWLLSRCEKIIVAYIENNNIFPKLPSNMEYDTFANNFKFEVVYLQHGVLHFDMPWKYSRERLVADYIVVSAEHEKKLFMKNGFRCEQLLETGMPRFDMLRCKKKKLKKKILFAPSWRSYLVGSNNNGVWEAYNKKFVSSSYYLKFIEFLSASQLQDLLVDNDYEIDVKIHPIFDVYKDLFVDKLLFGNRIHFVDDVCIQDYQLLITDFSSFMFDFLYLDIPVISFIPDYDEVLCGMNGYHKIDFIDKVQQEEIAKTARNAIELLNRYFISGSGLNYDVNFCREKDNNITVSAMDLIYNHIYNHDLVN